MTVEDLIQRFRELTRRHPHDQKYALGVTDCIRVLLEEWEKQEKGSDVDGRHDSLRDMQDVRDRPE